MVRRLVGFLAAGGLFLVVGCAAPAPVARVAPLDLAPSSNDLLHAKMSAYEAGVAAGKRIQLRHDQAALTAATAALVSEAAAPDCAGAAAPAAAAPALPATAPIAPPASALAPLPAPTYSSGGPAVPISRGN